MKEQCERLFEHMPGDNLLVKLAKVLPNGFQNLSETLGFNNCSGEMTIFQHLITNLEPVVYFIISLF